MNVRDLIEKLEEIENKELEVVFNMGEPDKEQSFIEFGSSYHKVIDVDEVLMCSYYEGDFEYCEISISSEEDEFLKIYFS